MTTEALPPTLAANPRLGNWLRISSDGAVEIRSGKVELGQGVLTALAQVAAEELDVDVARIKMTAATTDLSPDEGLTAGSLSIQHSGAALRQVCAEVRDIYIGIAAEKLAVPKEELTIDDGQIFAEDGAATSYWELADDTLMDRAANGDASSSADHLGVAAPRACSSAVTPSPSAIDRSAPALEEQPRRSRCGRPAVAEHHRLEQRGPTELVDVVDVDVGLEQRRHLVDVPAVGRGDERDAAVAVGRAQVRARAQHLAEHRDVAGLPVHQQRVVAVCVLEVHVRAGVDEHAHHVDVAAPSRRR